MGIAMAEATNKPPKSKEVAIPEQKPDKSSKKRKKKSPQKHILTQFTLRNPCWTYIHVQHTTASPSTQALDAITAQLQLTAALTQFLGLHGAAISFDILKIEDQNVWIRLPAEDRAAFIAAVGGYVRGPAERREGWVVKGWSHWDAGVRGGDGGQDVFGD